MPRQKNTRPTNIYWLYDTRPETVAVFGPEGQPFYCGKTVNYVERRLVQHVSHIPAAPTSPTSLRLVECGRHVRTELIETVSLDGNWIEREQFWIAELRKINPNLTNLAKGGQGAAGYVFTAEDRMKVSLANRGKKRTLEQRQNMRDGWANRIVRPRPKRKAVFIIPRTPEQKAADSAKMRAAKLGKKLSDAHKTATGRGVRRFAELRGVHV